MTTPTFWPPSVRGEVPVDHPLLKHCIIILYKTFPTPFCRSAKLENAIMTSIDDKLLSHNCQYRTTQAGIDQRGDNPPTLDDTHTAAREYTQPTNNYMGLTRL